MNKTGTIIILIMALTLAVGADSFWNAGDTRIPRPIRDALGTIDDQLVASDWDTGVAGGRTIYGGNAASNNLTIEATSNATDGTIILYDSTVNVENGLFVHNEAGGDFDFRVEGDTLTHLIFADAGNDRVGVGTSSPDCAFEVSGETQLEAGNVTINEDSGDFDFRVESDNNANMLQVDAGNDGVGVGMANAGNASLEVANGARINEGGGDYDTVIESDNNTAFFTVDASTDSLGIGAAPSGTYTLEVTGPTQVTGALTATSIVADGSGLTALGGNTTLLKIWTAFKYCSIGPAEFIDSSGAENDGYAVANGTAIIGLDTYEVYDNGVLTTIAATGEVFGVLAGVADLGNTAEAWLLISYDGGTFTATMSDTCEVGGATPDQPAVPTGDSPILLLYVSNNNAAVFDWGTDNWDAANVTTSKYRCKWPWTGTSAFDN